MTTRTDTTLSVRQDRRLIRPNAHSKRFLLARDRRPARDDRAGATAGQPRDRPRPVGLDVRREAARRQARPSRRRSAGSSRTTGSASSSTTTWSTSSSSRRPRRPRRVAARSSACATVEARGSTNLGEGWLRGCEQVAGHLAELRRQPLPAPDRRPRQRRDHRPGRARRSHAAELRARGVSTSTFGVGNDFDERLLQALADAGGGHFYYIADAPQIRDAITSEVGETLEVVARDVDLEITARDDIRIEPISPYPATTRGNRTIVVARRPRLRAGRRGRPAAVVPVRRARPGDGRHRRPRPTATASSGPAGSPRAEPVAADLDLRRRPRQRRPAARPRRRPSGRPPVRRPRAAGGRPAQPRRATTTAPDGS